MPRPHTSFSHSRFTEAAAALTRPVRRGLNWVARKTDPWIVKGGDSFGSALFAGGLIVHRHLSDGTITPLKKYAMASWIVTSGVGIVLPILLRSGTRVGRWLGKQDTIHFVMSGGIAASSAAYGAGLLATGGSLKDTVFAFCVTAGNAMTIAHKLMRVPEVGQAFKAAAREATQAIERIKRTRAWVYASAIALRAVSYVPLAMIDAPRAVVAAAFGVGLYTIFRRAYLTRPDTLQSPQQPSPPIASGDRHAILPPRPAA